MATRPNNTYPAVARTVIGVAVGMVLSAKGSLLEALPVGATTVAGRGQITETGSTLTVDQSSSRLAINWQSFNIGAAQAVVFKQPSAQSIALNRVLGQNPSVILGTLTANGQVFVLNPNGVLFGRSAQVSVGALLASTLQISVEDFLAGRYTLTGTDSAGSVVNQGTLQSHDGGYIALLGSHVINEGIITARLGTVALGAGKQVSLTINDGHLLSFSVDRDAVDAFVSNKQLIQADGGTVILTARATDALLSTVINNEGVVEARSVSSRDGVILLNGGTSGVVASSGTLDTSGKSPGERGGHIELTGDKIGLLGNAVVNASGSAGGGSILVGGDTQGSSPAVHNAQAAYVSPNAILSADALESGNGGKVVVWSDETTRFAGTISARGGQNGGNGGSVETSGKAYLDASGSVNASAPAGQAGEWLLDPYNVTLSTAATSNGAFAAGNFTPTATGAIANITAIQTSLNGGTGVTINTAGAGTDAGNITVANAIAKTAGSAATLTLNATNLITFSTGANLTSTTGALNITMNAGAGGITNLRNVNTNGGVLTFNSSGAVTQASGSVISGSGSLVKDNTGLLTLSGANTYTGSTTINAGTLRLSAAARIAAASALTVAPGAVFDLNNFAQTMGSIAGDGSITLGTGILTAGGDNTSTTFSGVISGTGGLTKAGAGTTTLSGVNTYAGTTSITGGALSLTGGSAIADTSAVTLANTAGLSLVLNDTNETIGSLAGGGTTGGSVLLGAATLTTGGKNTATTYSGAISGSGGLTKVGTGAMTLSGANTYSGPTSINAGSLVLGAANRIDSASDITVAAGATFSLNNFAQTAGSIAGAGTLSLGSGALTADVSNATTTYSGVITGTNGSIIKQGTGTFTLSGANTYTGATTVAAGTLVASSATAFGSTAGGVVVANGATLDINSVAIGAEALNVNGSGVGGNGALIATGTAAVAGIVTLSGASDFSTPGSTDTLTLSGVINGANALSKLGAGTLVLSGANTYSGATNISSGTIRLGAANRIAATSAITILSGATLNLNNFAEAAGSITGDGSITLGTGTLTAGGNNTSTTFSGVISGTGGFTKAGTGTTTLSGVNTYSGTTSITGGTLSLTGGSAIADTSAVTLANTAGVSLALNGTDETIGSLAGGGTTGGNVALGAATLTTGGNNTATTYIGVVSGTGGLKKVGTGAMILSGANTYSGPTSINAGTLQLGAANRIAATSDITVAAGAIFNLANFSETAGSISGAGNITLGSGALSSGIDDASTTFSGVISGTGTVIKQGSGTLILSGANTYSGATIVSAGTLVASSATAFGSTAGGVVVANGATLDINSVAIGAEALNVNGSGVRGSGALIATGTASVAGNVTLSGASDFSTPGSTDTLTLSGVISGANALSKLGAGTLVLAGANTYSGATSINSGTIRLGAANRIAATSAITILSGATLNLNNFAEAAGSITGGGSISLGTGTLTAGGNSTSTTFSGAISGTGGFTKAGTGTTTLSGANTYTGATTVSAGTLSLLGGSAIADTSAVALANTAGVSLALNGTDETIGSLAGGGATGGNVALGAGTLTTGGNNAATTYTGVISGTGGLTKMGTGAMILSGGNTYSGPTNINAGTLQLSAANRIAATSDITVASGATFNLANFAETAGSIAGAGNITLGSGALSAGADNASTTFSGVISGTGTITKQGTGALTLSGANTYSGATTVSAGTLVASKATALGTTAGGVVVANGATLKVDNVAIGAEAVALNGSGVGGNGALIGAGTASLAGNITLSTSSIIGTPGVTDALTLPGVISGANALTKVGAGTLTLSGTNTYAGITTIGEGKLRSGAANRIPTTSAISIAGGAVFDLNGFAQTAASIAGAGAVTLGAGTLTAGGNNTNTTFSGSMSGTGGFTKVGTGTTTFSGTNTYTGPTTVSAGTLSLLGGDAIADTSAVTMANTAGVSLALNGTNETIGSLAGGGITGGNVALGIGTLTTGGNNSATTYFGVIGGTGGLTKMGTGIMTLSGGNTYSGPTNINAGSLQLGAPDRLAATADITIAAGASLDLHNFAQTAGSIAGAGTVALGSGALTAGGDNASTTFSGVISGTGTLTKQGTGALTLSGANTYTGTTTISAGTLVASNAAALGTTSGGVTVADGATLEIDDAAIGAESLTLNGSGVGGAGALIGRGTASLAGPVDLGANTLISAGAGDALALNSTVDGAHSLAIGGGGTVSLGNSVGSATPLTSITSDSTTALNINGGLLVTSGNQTYNGSTTFASPATLRIGGSGDIAANGPVAGSLSLDIGSGNATLINASNDLATFSVTSANTVSLVNANSLTMGAANLGSLQAQTLSGDLTLTGAITAGASGDSIILVAARNFDNSGGSLNAGAGRWLIYSTDPAANSLGALTSDFKRYNCTYTRGCLTPGTTIPDAGNGLLYGLAPMLSVSANSVTVVYGDPASALTFSATGLVDGDTTATALTGALTRTGGGSSSSGHEVVGTNSISQGSVAASLGYQLTFAGASYTVSPRPLGIAAAAQNKIYDGTNTATVTLSDDPISGDAVAASFASATFSDRNVGVGKSVSVTGISLLGADAGNYVIQLPITTTADITPKMPDVRSDAYTGALIILNQVEGPCALLGQGGGNSSHCETKFQHADGLDQLPVAVADSGMRLPAGVPLTFSH